MKYLDPKNVKDFWSEPANGGWIVVTFVILCLIIVVLSQ